MYDSFMTVRIDVSMMFVLIMCHAIFFVMCGCITRCAIVHAVYKITAGHWPIAVQLTQMA